MTSGTIFFSQTVSTFYCSSAWHIAFWDCWCNPPWRTYVVRTQQSYCALVPVLWTRPGWVIEPRASLHPCRPLFHQAPTQTWIINSHLTPGLCPIHLHFHPAICFLNKTPQCHVLTHSARKGPWSPWCSTSRPKLNYLLFAQSRAMTPFLSLEIYVRLGCVSVNLVLRVCSCICVFLAG